MRRRLDIRGLPFRGAGAIIALALASCTSMPELNEVKVLPDMRSFLPSNSTTYTNVAPIATRRPVGPDDLVDSQGLCAAAAVAAAPAPDAGAGAGPATAVPVATAGAVALEMTECEVARALGAPNRAEQGTNERGERSMVLTYTSADRAGIYRFAAGRLVSIERTPDAEPPPKPEKKKKVAPAKKPAQPRA